MEKFLTKYEIGRIIAARALQLAAGAPPLVKPEKNEKVYEVAEREFKNNLLPFVVVRVLPSGKIERIELIKKKEE